MLYKAFAAFTLIAAPVIVMLAQGFAPAPQPQSSAAVVQPAAAIQMAPTMPQVAAAPMPAPEPAAPPASFGQPMPDAAKPFLSPGDGLPGGSSSAEPQDNTAEPDTGTDASSN